MLTESRKEAELVAQDWNRFGSRHFIVRSHILRSRSGGAEIAFALMGEHSSGQEDALLVPHFCDVY
jgi:hypothetical protein